MMHFDYSLRRRIILGIVISLTIILYIVEDFFSPIRLLSKIGLIVIFYVVDHLFDARFKPRHYIFIVILGIAGFVLSPLYFKYSSYDKILHFLSPILFCSIAFHLINKLSLKKSWKLIFTFFVVIGGIGVFEISEYALDLVFDLKLQGVFLKEIIEGKIHYTVISNSLDDTMVDMVFGILGAGIYTISRAIKKSNIKNQKRIQK